MFIVMYFLSCFNIRCYVIFQVFNCAVTNSFDQLFLYCTAYELEVHLVDDITTHSFSFTYYNITNILICITITFKLIVNNVSFEYL